MDWTTLLDKHLSQIESAVSEKAPQAWAMLVQQKFVSGIVDLIFLAIGVLAFVVFGRWMAKKDLFDDGCGMSIGGYFFVIGCVGMVFLIMFAGSSALNALIFPEGAALRQIMSSLGK